MKLDKKNFCFHINCSIDYMYICRSFYLSNYCSSPTNAFWKGGIQVAAVAAYLMTFFVMDRTPCLKVKVLSSTIHGRGPRRSRC